jgi:GABA permease
MPPPVSVLVVANRTADSEELRAALIERSTRGPIQVTLLAPAAWEVIDPHGGTESARRRLRSAIERLGADGVAVRGVVGDANPVVAVEQIWEAERFDEVIVSTLPAHLSRWLGIDLPHRVERFTGRAVRHVIASERAAPAET